MKKWKIAGIHFDHMHRSDLLRMAHAHPRAAKQACAARNGGVFSLHHARSRAGQTGAKNRTTGFVEPALDTV